MCRRDFAGDDDFIRVQSVVLCGLGGFERGGDECFDHDLLRRPRGGARVVFVHDAREDFLVETAPVDANAHGVVVFGGDFDHLCEFFVTAGACADIAWVDAVFG